MTERQFNELRRYREAEGSCISDWDGAKPLASLRSKGWVREVVKGCWQITDEGIRAFDDVVSGAAILAPDRDAA